jgi:hypothetical protein
VTEHDSGNGDTVTMSDVAVLDTGTVAKSGMIYLGSEFIGKKVTYALRVEGEAEDVESGTESAEATSD